jgi:hypothetical protein
MANDVIELRYGLDSFRSDWRHCSLGSDFLAETAFKTPRMKQLASTAINEVLELAFRLGAKASKSWVQTKIKPGQSMHLALDVKVKPDHVAQVAAELAQFRLAPSAYYENLLGQADPGVFFGLGYLAHDLHAVITIELKESVLFVQVELPLRSAVEES